MPQWYRCLWPIIGLHLNDCSARDHCNHWILPAATDLAKKWGIAHFRSLGASFFPKRCLGWALNNNNKVQKAVATLESITLVDAYYDVSSQILTDFQNSFTVRIRRKFAITLSLKIPPHIKCVPTLPCKILNHNFTDVYFYARDASDHWYLNINLTNTTMKS